MIGERIKSERERQKLPQKAVADALSIDIPMYSRIERGLRPIKKEQLPTIAEVLGMSYNELLKLWLADKIYNVLAEEEEEAPEVLSIVAESLTPFNKITK